jgi:hypothetical protein
MADPRRFYGKYRGTVENNVDPLQQGRVQIRCPAVLGDGTLSWAMPCVPYAGDGVGLFLVPPAGANIWVEFEGGDANKPILAGCFWGVGEVPAAPAVEQMKVLQTDTTTFEVNDLLGTLTITATTPIGAAVIAAGPDALELSIAGRKVSLSPVSVTINDGALEVL